MSLTVRTSSGGVYPVRVVRALQPALGEIPQALGPITRVVLITDENVAALHLDSVRAVLSPSAVHVVPAGEPSKGPDGLLDVWEFLRDAGCDRRSLVVGLGGGVVGDLAGFAAATYMRGVRIVHLPTTLLAMVDSAIGGKTAIDLGAKNLVGAFHAPSAVLCHLPFLATLPPREVRCGLGEVWKTAILSGEALLARLESDAPRLRALDLSALEPVVNACLVHKAGVVERDEREGGERALLNLGHTLGHALEASDEALSHGEAVAVGGVFACRLAQRLGWLSAADADRFVALAEALGLPTRPSAPPDVGALLALLERDKKAVGGTVRWVLPRGPGRCELTDAALEEQVRGLLSELFC